MSSIYLECLSQRNHPHEHQFLMYNYESFCKAVALAQTDAKNLLRAKLRSLFPDNNS